MVAFMLRGAASLRHNASKKSKLRYEPVVSFVVIGFLVVLSFLWRQSSLPFREACSVALALPVPPGPDALPGITAMRDGFPGETGQ